MAQTYEILIEAKDKASSVFERVVQNAQRDFEKMEKDRASAQEKAFARAQAAAEKDASKTGLQRVKAQLGEDSQVGLLSKTLIGTGAIAGVTVILNALERSTEKAADLANQFRAGKISTGELVGELIGAVPVLGQAYSITRNIGEAISGAKGETEKLIQKLGDIAPAADKAAQVFKDIGKGRRDQDNQIGDANKGRAADELRRAGFAGSADLSDIRKTREAAQRDQLQQIKDQFKERIQSLQALQATQRAAASAALNANDFAAYKENSDAEMSTIKAITAAKQDQAKAEAKVREETQKSIANDTKNKLGDKSLAQVNALSLGQKLAADFKDHFGKSLQEAAKGSALGQFADAFGSKMIEGIQKQQGGFVAWLKGAQERVAQKDLANDLQRSLTAQQGTARDAVLRNLGEGDRADFEALKRDRDRDVEQFKSDAEKKLRDTSLSQASKEAIAKNRDALIAARDQQFGQGAIALERQRLAQSRPSQGFDLQESRHLTGVSNSGLDERDKDIADLSKAAQDFFTKFDPTTVAEAVKKLADAATGNKLLVASLG